MIPHGARLSSVTLEHPGCKKGRKKAGKTAE
jgi:hypothetical protein